MKIIDIRALQILDSRSNPTLQVEVYLEDGSSGVFTVPSGASTGIHEAHELRDHDPLKYKGNGVEKAVENLIKIKPKLINKRFTQESLDNYLIDLDGTPNKENLGANAILGVSIAYAKASAKFNNLPLYEYLYRLINKISFSKKTYHTLDKIHLFANIINGGLHSGNRLNIQEFMIIPHLDSPQEEVRAICEIYQSLKKLIEEKYGKSNTAVGDEGGFAPDISKAKEALDLIMAAKKDAGYEENIFIALDTAASDFYDKEKKIYTVEPRNKLDYKELTKYYNDLIEKYPIISIEDPMDEDDFTGFAYFVKHIKKLKFENPLTRKNEVLVVGDDLTVTNPTRVEMAIEKKLCNSLLLKINQIGTLTESIAAYKLVDNRNWHTIVSHRSGETPDDFIADLAIAMAGSIKLGAPARGERVAKYNRLLNIYR